jgi:hypothetical protein
MPFPSPLCSFCHRVVNHSNRIIKGAETDLLYPKPNINDRVPLIEQQKKCALCNYAWYLLTRERSDLSMKQKASAVIEDGVCMRDDELV